MSPRRTRSSSAIAPGRHRYGGCRDRGAPAHIARRVPATLCRSCAGARRPEQFARDAARQPRPAHRSEAYRSTNQRRGSVELTRLRLSFHTASGVPNTCRTLADAGRFPRATRGSRRPCFAAGATSCSVHSKYSPARTVARYMLKRARPVRTADPLDAHSRRQLKQNATFRVPISTVRRMLQRGQGRSWMTIPPFISDLLPGAGGRLGPAGPVRFHAVVAARFGWPTLGTRLPARSAAARRPRVCLKTAGLRQ